MKKSNQKNLVLRKQTLKHLVPAQLQDLLGGARILTQACTGDSGHCDSFNCPSTTN